MVLKKWQQLKSTMISPSLPEQVQLFKSVFKGRDDVFAIRWEKGNKSGYMPAHSFDPYFYRAHKAKGGTFQNFKYKTFLMLTNSVLND
jgi:hypothetical protein